MKKFLFPCLVVAMSLLSLSAFSQDKKSTSKEDTIPPLGLAGDNLDLYAVLDVFQKSKTIEAFEKALNEDGENRINNLDLNLDKKIDFIKVVTKKNDDSYQFILRVDISKTESQDVAVILLDKNKDKKISLQIVGDEELYGKDYVIEPKGNSSVTANPGYTGDNPVTVNVPASTTTVNVVQSAPIVQYVYSPAYVPYAPPYYYGYYPPWFGFATVMAVGIYRSNHWGYHGGYYGGHYGGNNNIIINNNNNFNNYNNNKMRSTTVSDNRARGNYGDGAGANRRNNASASNRQSPSTANRASTSNRQSPSASNRASTSNRQSPSASNRQSTPSTRQTTPSATNRSSGFSSSSSGFSGGGRSMSSGGGRSMGGGGGRSMGGGRRGR